MLFLLIFFFILSAVIIFARANEALAPKLDKNVQKEIIITPEIEKKFPIKTHHSKLSFKCIFCHEGQGDDPEQFSTPGDEGCLSCHKSKKLLAKRLEFMDTLHVNPHNSIHDGPILYCDECHNEHKPSINMCMECHEKEIKTDIWMRKTP